MPEAQTQPEPKLQTPHHRVFMLGTSAFLFVLAVFVAVLVSTTVSRLTAPAWDPLIFPTAHIASPASITLANGVPSSPSITVVTFRCNTSPEPVQYKAVKQWISISSPGNSVLVATTIEIQPPGCVNNSSLQPIPGEVISRATALVNQTHEPSVWEVSAVDTPLGHLHSVPITWTSSPITFTEAP